MANAKRLSSLDTNIRNAVPNDQANFGNERWLSGNPPLADLRMQVRSLHDSAVERASGQQVVEIR
jgi:hypothetical protein